MKPVHADPIHAQVDDVLKSKVPEWIETLKVTVDVLHRHFGAEDFHRRAKTFIPKRAGNHRPVMITRRS